MQMTFTISRGWMQFKSQLVPSVPCMQANVCRQSQAAAEWRAYICSHLECMHVVCGDCHRCQRAHYITVQYTCRATASPHASPYGEPIQQTTLPPRKHTPARPTRQFQPHTHTPSQTQGSPCWANVDAADQLLGFSEQVATPTLHPRQTHANPGNGHTVSHSVSHSQSSGCIGAERPVVELPRLHTTPFAAPAPDTAGAAAAAMPPAGGRQ